MTNYLVSDAVLYQWWKTNELPGIVLVCAEKRTKAMEAVNELHVVSMTVLDRHFGSGSGSEPNHCQMGGPGCLQTRTVNSGTVRWKSPNPSALGWSSAGRPACPSVDFYNVLVFAVG